MLNVTGVWVIGNSPGADSPEPEPLPEEDGPDAETEPLPDAGAELPEDELPEEHPAMTESSIAAERTLDKTFLFVLMVILLFKVYI